MKFASLFAGIGGFELGLTANGMENVLMCDVDKASQAVLTYHFPDVPLASDVRGLKRLPKGTDVLTAGFPCQDLSSVGQKEGIKGERSGLISEVFRLIKISRPEWVVIENVYFMLHLKKGAGIEAIVSNLEKLGYSWAYRTLDSLAFGLPQRRRRVFVVASLTGDPRNVLLASCGNLNREPISRESPIGFYWTEGTYATGLAADAIPPLKGGSTIGIPSPPAILMPTGEVGTPHIEDAEALQGFPRGWTDHLPEQTKASARWKLIGNAVPVNVVRWIGEQMTANAAYESSVDEPLVSGTTWPDAAWGIAGQRFRSRVSHYPASPVQASLAAMLRNAIKPLSARATNGFLHRVRKGNLRFPDGFLPALETHGARAS